MRKDNVVVMNLVHNGHIDMMCSKKIMLTIDCAIIVTVFYCIQLVSAHLTRYQWCTQCKHHKLFWCVLIAVEICAEKCWKKKSIFKSQDIGDYYYVIFARFYCEILVFSTSFSVLEIATTSLIATVTLTKPVTQNIN